MRKNRKSFLEKLSNVKEAEVVAFYVVLKVVLTLNKKQIKTLIM